MLGIPSDNGGRNKMIGTLSIKCNAAHPEMALPVIYTYKNSPSNIRVLDVPKKIGNWQITDVTLKVIYPNNTVVEVFCVRTAGAWVGTIAGTPVVGKTSNGFVITASGIDENEHPVSGYVLGVGDIEVMDCDTSLNPIANSYLMRIFETRPQTLNNGDVFIDADGSLVVNLNGELHETVSFQEVEAMIPTKVSDLTNDAGYLTSVSWNDIQNKPSIPTKTSDLTNDSDFTTNAALNTGLATKQNALSTSQVDALNCCVGEHQTVVTYADHTTQTFDIYGGVENPSWKTNAVDVKFGTGVTSLGFGALEGATTLQSVTIPESVTSIAMHAFFSCPNLHTLVIPESVTSIDQDTFDSSGLTSILFKGRTTTEVQQMANYPWGIQNTSVISGQLFEETEARNNALDLTVEEYKTKIDFTNAASMAFNWYGEITKQTMIDEGLFDDDPLQLTWIKNPDIIVLGPGVTSIGADTFFSARSSHVEIPRTVTSIGLNAFYTSAGPEPHEFIFKDRTLAEVQAMANYPWGINDTTQIKTWNDTSKEYVDSLVGDIDTALDSINGEII